MRRSGLLIAAGVITATAGLFLNGAAYGQAAAPALKVYISADMEGITGVVSETQSGSSGSEYETYRQQMTDDVNAAIEGALAAGATEIVVSDSHGSGQNLLVHELHPAARLVRSFPRPLDMMEGIDASFGAALFVGYHASADTPDAILAHTGNLRISRFRLNGTNVAEGGISAVAAGHFGVPVVMISGDHAAVEEMRALVGSIEGAVVKQAYGYRSGMVLSPEATRDLIKSAARRGVERRAQYEPYKLAGPITVDVSFYSTLDAEVASLFPGARRTGARSVGYQLADAIAVVKLFNGLMFLRPQ